MVGGETPSASPTTSAPGLVGPQAPRSASQPDLAPAIRARRSAHNHAQRSASDAPAPARAAALPSPTGPLAGMAPPTPRSGAASTDTPVRIDRSESGAQAAAELRSNAFTSGDTIVLPPSHGPIDSPRSQRLLAHELVHVGQQRRLGNDLPEESSPAGQVLEREARSAESFADSGRSTLPLAAARATGSSSSGAAPAAAGPDAQRAANTALTLRSSDKTTDSPHSTIAPGVSAMRSLTGASASAPQRQDDSSSLSSMTSPGSDTGDEEAELDDLARRLYDRLRYRLGRELLLDRERAGVLTDLR
jgi:hypothetical protein